MHVKKCRSLLVVLCSVMSSLHADSSANLSPVLQNFLTEISSYQLNAPWLVATFMSMNLHEFSAAWTYIVDLMKSPDKRWRYFCDTMQNYDHTCYTVKWIWQCHFFELWLNKLYVNIDDLSLMYDHHGFCQSNKKYAHIFSCWRVLTENGQGDHRAIYDFYAYYADCLAACLLKGMKIAYLEIDTPLYDKAWHTSFSLSEGLKIMVKQLQTSDYAPRYSAQLDRYSQILELVKQEKIKNILQH